jgi:hypothetical protein
MKIEDLAMSKTSPHCIVISSLGQSLHLQFRLVVTETTLWDDRRKSWRGVIGETRRHFEERYEIAERNWALNFRKMVGG